MKKEYSKPVAMVGAVPLYMMSGSDTSVNLGINNGTPEGSGEVMKPW